jgi:hypothetical protein
VPSQCVTSGLLVTVQVAIVIEWLVLKPCVSSNDNSSSSSSLSHSILYDVNYVDIIAILTFVYVLIILTVGFAAGAVSKRQAEADKESLSVLIASVGCGLLLLCWATSLALIHQQRHLVTSIALATSAWFIVTAMFLPKLVLVFRLSRGKSQAPSSSAVNRGLSLRHNAAPQMTLSKEQLTISPPLRNYDYALQDFD